MQVSRVVLSRAEPQSRKSFSLRVSWLCMIGGERRESGPWPLKLPELPCSDHTSQRKLSVLSGSARLNGPEGLFHTLDTKKSFKSCGPLQKWPRSCGPLVNYNFSRKMLKNDFTLH